MSEVLVPFVKSLIVLDADGNRLLAKYYDGKVKSDQIKFEANLHKKTKTVAAKTDAEVVLFDQEIAVYRSGSDCKFFICGPVEENELILVGVLDVIYETVSSLLRGQVDKRTMLDNLELVLLTIDEALDHGHIMELESSSVSSRVLMKGSDGGPQVALGDLSISQALGLAKDQFMRSMKPRQT
eukprot:gene11396-23846_t